MSLLADALQPFFVRELAAISGRLNHMSLADIITAPAAAYDLDFENATQSIVLDFMASDFLAPALAADCCRLSTASFQTIVTVQQEIMERDSVAWSLIKLYYSAFYAGHALIRVFGEACSYFDRAHVTQLATLSVALGRTPGFPIDRGLYRCVLGPGATALTCTRARGFAGGAHESFWDVFGNALRTFGEGILLGSMPLADAQEASSQLDALRSVLSRRTGHGWLSVIRNDLQYRQRFGVWFPSQFPARDRQALRGIIRAWNQDPMEIDLTPGRFGSIGEFVACCVFIIALCHTMLSRLAERSAAGTRSFVRLGPMVFLNDRAA